MDLVNPPIPFSGSTLATIVLGGAICLMITLLVVVVILVIAGECSRKRGKYHPVAGSIFNQLLNFHRLHDYMTELASKHKTYRLLGLFRSEVYTSDPANVEYILKTNFPNYAKGWYHHNILTDLLGDGIFTVDGEKWREQRKTASHEFSTKMLKDFSSGVFRTNAAKLALKLSELKDSSNQSVDIQDLFAKSTLDSVFKVLLGGDLNTMCGTNTEGTHFSNCFDEANEITLFRYVDVLWRVKRFLNIGSEAKLKKNIEVIDRYIYKLIRSQTEQVHNSHHESTMKKRDILSRFIELNRKDSKYLKDIILSFIIAGKDTTASTLSWFFYMMCKNPTIQEKIAIEVMEATNLHHHHGGSSSLDEIVSSITEEALNKMHYLHAALTETLRLYPAIPLDGKFCMGDDTLPDGYSVKKGDMVAYQPYAMGRMKFIWGDDAEEFRPERWLNQDALFHPQSSFKFTAFQGGPRICLGKEFAYRQMKIFSAVLLGSFMFKLSDEQKAVNYRTMLTLHINGGLHLRAFDRFGKHN